jgi:putative transposase
MEKSYFTERQIIGFLNKQEAGKSVSNLCREHIFSQPILYQLKTKYGGKDVGQLK